MTGVIENHVCRLDFYEPGTAPTSLEHASQIAGQIASWWGRGLVLGQSSARPTLHASAAVDEARQVAQLLRAPVQGVRVAALPEVQAECLLAQVLRILQDRPDLTGGIHQGFGWTNSWGSGTARDDPCLPGRELLDPQHSRGPAIHPDTLRYRLSRIRMLTGINVDDQLARLAIQLATLSVDDLAEAGRLIPPR